MELLDTVVDFPKKFGEDSVFFNLRHSGVIDGSTPIRVSKIGKYPTQANWLAQELSLKLNENKDDSISEICSEFINKNLNKNILELEDENKTCAVLVGIELEDDELIVNIIGDCSIAIKFKDGTVKSYSDARINKFSNKTKEVKRKAIDENKNYKLAVKEQMALNRKMMNVEGGFWTVSFKGDFKQGLIKHKFNISEIDKVLMYSDGFDRLFNLTVINLDDIFNQKISLRECVNNLRLEEDKLLDSKEIKKKDDASAILIKI